MIQEATITAEGSDAELKFYYDDKGSPHISIYQDIELEEYLDLVKEFQRFLDVWAEEML